MATAKQKPKTTDTKTTDVEINDETEASVIVKHTPLGETKEIRFTGKVKQNDNTELDNDTENQDSDFENEDSDLSFTQSDYQEIPKDKIDVIFDELENDFTQSDYFYAKLTRIPDAMQDGFYISCNSEMPLGVVQFSLADRFNFIPAIQKRNNNSGGRFNIAVYDSQQKQIQTFIGYDNPYSPRKNPIYKAVGAVNLLIPNPVREEIKDAPNGLESVLTKMIEMQRESNQQILNAINNKPPQSEIEKLLMQKAIENLMQPQRNDSFEEKMLTIFAMPEMVGKMAKRMFPEPEKPPAPAEQTTFDKILQFSQLPPVQNAFERIGNIAEYIVEQKLTPQPVTENPQNAPEQIDAPEIDENMRLLLNDLVIELESESEINAENPTIIKLKSDFPEHFQMIQMLCKGANFETVFQMLIAQANNMQPFPFEPFVNETRNGFNERGNKAIERLKLVYAFLRDN